MPPALLVSSSSLVGLELPERDNDGRATLSMLLRREDDGCRLLVDKVFLGTADVDLDRGLFVELAVLGKKIFPVSVSIASDQSQKTHG